MSQTAQIAQPTPGWLNASRGLTAISVTSGTPIPGCLRAQWHGWHGQPAIEPPQPSRPPWQRACEAGCAAGARESTRWCGWPQFCTHPARGQLRAK
eukprot:2277666-Prymnesium_polylepis.1